MFCILTISEKTHFWRGSILHRLFFLICNLPLLHTFFQPLTTTKEPIEHQHATARKAAQGQPQARISLGLAYGRGTFTAGLSLNASFSQFCAAYGHNTAEL